MDKLCGKYSSAELSKRTKLLIGTFMLISFIVMLGISIEFIFFKYAWINVHLIPHTHNDVGWIRTPEDYYKNCVKYILDHVILELQRDSNRRFIYVETYFFWQWWQEQTEVMKAVVKSLISHNQLEIVGGGWCMSDEAVTHYQSFIDQSTWGFRRLNDTFGPGVCPTVGWQIDTFGHSRGIASLLAQMGFSSLFFARIDLNDRKYRKTHKEMEFVWTGNENLGEASSIFTSVFYNHYSAPTGFDFEGQASETSIDYSRFARYVRKQSEAFRTNNVLVPMGDDFRYLNAQKYFSKMDMLIRFFENNHDFRIKVFYSTPSLYTIALKKKELTWSEVTEDFFPYASEFETYWVGYYTSRPSLKLFERISNNFLQITKQLFVFSDKGTKFFNELTTLREAVAVVQHHDAVTGTAQQHVTDHYVAMLHKGIKNCEEPIDEALGNLSVKKADFQRPMYQSCLLLNISSCDVTERSFRFVVTVYNPLSRSVNHYVRIPVSEKSFSVRTSKGCRLPSQIVAIPKAVRKIPGRISLAKAELIFRATNVPALGFKSFYVTTEESPKFVRKCPKIFNKKNVKLFFDPSSQLLSGIKTDTSNITIKQNFKYYNSVPHLSGAYIFQPAEYAPVDISGEVETKLLSNGELVKEYQQTFSKWATQIIRTYKDEDYVEFEWLVGPIPTSDNQGKEVVLLYSSNINSGKVFYTDVNGMDLQKRVKDYHEWQTKSLTAIPENYYPVTTMISVKDDYEQLYVMVDRPQGGTSLRSGEIELMVHRRLLFDDKKGVNEALNEIAFGDGLVVRGRHWVLFGKKQLELERRAKLFSQNLHSQPWLFFFDATSVTFQNWNRYYITEFSGLYAYVPQNVRVLTLEPWREDTILLRLEHVFEKLPVFRLSNAPVQISLKNLFKNFDVLEARETTLGADRWLSDSVRLKWKKRSRGAPKRTKPSEDLLYEEMSIYLKPQQIRTFILKIKPKN